MENMGRNVLGRWADFYGSRYNCGGDIGADQGEIGFGDGLLILAMGSVLKSGELLGVLSAALLLCGIYSGLQLLVFKKKRDTEIPFAPFLLVGYLGGILL